MKSRWKRFTDKIYTLSDLDVLLTQIRTTAREDFEEVSQQLWKEAELMNNPSLTELMENERIAFELLNYRKKKERTNRIVRMKKWGSIAAAVILCISFGGIYYFHVHKQTSIVFCEIQVPYGKMQTETLPDGTIVTLNAGSVLRYPEKFDSDKRYVEFTGEGFFDVSEGKNCPFIISTKGYDVKVLGTSFNLQNYVESEHLSLTLCSGKIQLIFEEEQISLRPGEQLLLNKQNNELERSKVNVRNYTSWMKGKLYFNKTPIEEVVRMLERYYDCRIELDSRSVFTNKVSGTHDNKSLEAVLHSIELATGIQSRKENERYILYKEN